MSRDAKITRSGPSGGGTTAARKIILDTNLWSYVGDEGSSENLRVLLAEQNCTVLLPPSMLMEILRNPDSGSRMRHVAAIGGIRGQRMASEAQLCAEEFVRLVKRARPDWLRSIADMATVAKFNRRWTKEWWKWAAENSDKAHEIVMGGDDVAPEATLTQRDNRRKMLNDSFASDFNHLLVSAEPRSAEVYLPGWHGHQVEGWRFEIAARYWRSMSTTRGRPGYDGMVETMRQWIGSYVDLRTAVSDPVDFANLWLCEATPHDVPRDWIRAALAYTQTTMKIGPGNARDEQHSAYLVDAHLFLSADRRLVAALQEVRRQALFPLAEPRITDLQNGARSALDAIAVALS